MPVASNICISGCLSMCGCYVCTRPGMGLNVLMHTCQRQGSISTHVKLYQMGSNRASGCVCGRVGGCWWVSDCRCARVWVDGWVGVSHVCDCRCVCVWVIGDGCVWVYHQRWMSGHVAAIMSWVCMCVDALISMSMCMGYRTRGQIQAVLVWC